MMVGLLIFSVLSVAPDVAVPSADDVPTATQVYADIAVADTDVTATVTDDAAVENASGPQNAKSPLVSINTDILDMSWTGAMDLADTEILRPTGIVLPFLESYPIDNFEVKLHLLNLRF